MGDTRRFDLFGVYIMRHATTTTRIADIAGGKGILQANLRQHGFLRVETFDKRSKHKRGGGMNYKHRLFTPQLAQGFQLLVGMHPDEATDVIIVSAIKNHIPFIVCPCCIKPTLTVYRGKRYYEGWVNHLENVATSGGYSITRTHLKMQGNNIVIHGRPK